jgi:hypothetical protein
MKYKTEDHSVAYSAYVRGYKLTATTHKRPDTWYQVINIADGTATLVSEGTVLVVKVTKIKLYSVNQAVTTAVDI